MNALGRMGLAMVAVLVVLAASPAQAGRHAEGWRQDHYGSRYNYHRERFHLLPRTGHAMRYRPRLLSPL